MAVDGAVANFTNSTANNSSVERAFNSDDAAWALANSFLILTMQTGFAMLECGSVSAKNMANIMIKNVCDVSIGGFAFWSVGYALLYGKPANWLCGYGDFFFTESDPELMGERYAHYFFHFSFASTATTIVSGAVAERMHLYPYMLFCFLNVFIYCFPAYWAWGEYGFLGKLGFYDFAGVTCVHLNGGASALVATLMLGPRQDRFENVDKYQMNSPVTALAGMFMLTWAWLGFNCGSTFRIGPDYWKICALVAVTTLNGCIGGGLMGLAMSLIGCKGKVDINYMINSVLGGLVAVTGGCPMFTPTEALLIGGIGAMVANFVNILLTKCKVDDPVGAVPVHLGAATWGTLALGIFGKNNFLDMMTYDGLVHGGGGMLLGIQLLGAVVVGMFSSTTTFLTLLIMKYTIGIRMSAEEEAVGADYCEHGIKNFSINDKIETILKKLDTVGEDSDRLPGALKEALQDINAIQNETGKDISGGVGPMMYPTKSMKDIDLGLVAKMEKEAVTRGSFVDRIKGSSLFTKVHPINDPTIGLRGRKTLVDRESGTIAVRDFEGKI